MKKLWLIDKYTNMNLGSTLIDTTFYGEDLPNTTSLKPLEQKEGHDVVFNKGIWAYKLQDIEEDKQEEEEITPPTEEEEALSYLNETDWVEIYYIKHQLGLEVIPEDSSKWDIIYNREVAKELLK